MIKSYSLLLAILSILLAVISGVFNYVPLPIYDMWDSGLGFYSQFSAGNLLSLWQQHNEHRILLSKLLFVISYKFFSGSQIFLIFVNYALISLICLINFLFIDNLFKDKANDNLKWIVKFTVVVFSFSLVQHENIFWAFQSQFYMSLLFPLLSFFFLAKFIDTSDIRYLGISLLTLVLSTMTMANGLIAFFVTIVLVLYLRSSLKVAAVLVITSAFMVALYIFGYKSPNGHASPFAVIVNQKIEVLLYVFNYIGGAMGYATGRLSFAIVYGSLITLFVLFLMCRTLLKSNQPYLVCLCGYVTYILLSSILTSLGRVNFGIEQAHASRYTTYALQLYSSLVIIAAYYARYNDLRIKNIFIACIVFLQSIFLIFQFSKFDSKFVNDDSLDLATLSLIMEYNDPDVLTALYPNPSVPYNMSKDPTIRTYINFPLKYTRLVDKIGTYVEFEASSNICTGEVVNIVKLEGGGQYKITGYIDATSRDQELLLIDKAKRLITGVGITMKSSTWVESGKSLRNFAAYSNKMDGQILYFPIQNCYLN